MKRIPFNLPFLSGNELNYITLAIYNRHLRGDGLYSQRSSSLLEEKLAAKKIFLTPSCSISLDMTSILTNISEGDEVILPSYTFPSSATAFVSRGATPVFVDIREDTLNIDESKIEERITDKTKVICVTHYGGISCEMDAIMSIAKKHNLFVIEDAAQSIFAKYKGKFLGTIGDMGTFSFHETKNINSGEGGAIIINKEKFVSRAEIIREKGTNRFDFSKGKIDKYSWVDIGSSFLMNEITAAFLFAQIEVLEEIINKRMGIWNLYMEGLGNLEDKGVLRRPIVPKDCTHNAHLFYILLENSEIRTELIKHLQLNNIKAVTHFEPLHKSIMGIKVAPETPTLPVTDDISSRLLRLPMYNELEQSDVSRVINFIKNFFK